MSAEKSVGTTLDWLKWSIVVALLAAGVVGNWYFQEVSLLIRVAAILAAATAAGLIAVQTERGQGIWTLIKEARTEIRRVVWPTNQETTQTTLVVLLIVLIFALILWGLDSLLSWIVSSIIG
ncbi:MAG: preprotein translocase subunit SecE [Gammaproteobacteria bacterium]|nr:preprotein translocase subunit SecE [Gammaproteobacteria bacterium]